MQSTWQQPSGPEPVRYGPPAAKCDATLSSYVFAAPFPARLAIRCAVRCVRSNQPGSVIRGIINARSRFEALNARRGVFLRAICTNPSGRAVSVHPKPLAGPPSGKLHRSHLAAACAKSQGDPRLQKRIPRCQSGAAPGTCVQRSTDAWRVTSQPHSHSPLPPCKGLPFPANGASLGAGPQRSHSALENAFGTP